MESDQVDLQEIRDKIEFLTHMRNGYIVERTKLRIADQDHDPRYRISTLNKTIENYDKSIEHYKSKLK